MPKMSLVIADVETTGMSVADNDIIEISFKRILDGEQKTWWMKAIHEDKISLEALEVNGHKLEDITWRTKAGKEKYRLPEEVLPEIENWLHDDHVTAGDRILVGHNIAFDYERMQECWRRCNTLETFPFSLHTLDTKMLSVFFDYLQGASNRYYSLSQIVKRLGITKRHAHSADQDVMMTFDLFQYCAKYFEDRIASNSNKLPIFGESDEPDIDETETETEDVEEFEEPEEEPEEEPDEPDDD